VSQTPVFGRFFSCAYRCCTHLSVQIFCLTVSDTQVVGELRSKYAVAIKLAAQRLTDAIFSQPGAAPCIILDKLYGASSSATVSSNSLWHVSIMIHYIHLALDNRHGLRCRNAAQVIDACRLQEHLYQCGENCVGSESCRFSGISMIEFSLYFRSCRHSCVIHTLTQLLPNSCGHQYNESEEIWTHAHRLYPSVTRDVMRISVLFA
jgi:hypothetical protein